MYQRKQCPVCEAPATPPLLSIPYAQAELQRFLSRIGCALPAEWFVGIPYTVHACAQCGGLFQGWVLDDEQLGRLYGQNEAA